MHSGVHTPVQEHLNEQSVLGDIQKKMKEWRDEIMVVVRQKRPVTSTVQQEIKFWKGKGNAVAQIEEQLKQPEVLASTLVLLKNYQLMFITFLVVGTTIAVSSNSWFLA
jgi:hypothetical protein